MCVLLGVVSGCIAEPSDGADEDDPADTASESSPAVSAPGGLKNLARTYGIRWGGVAKHSALQQDGTYRSKLADEFNVLTPENEMKMKYVQPDARSRYAWSHADAVVDFARSKGMAVHGHTLVWHKVPAWVESVPTGQLEAVMKEYVRAASGRYKGRVWAWDVVNEALNDDGTYRDSVWMKAMGRGYIAKAFWTARNTDPNAKLLYNDYSIETVNAKSNELYRLVKDLKAAGVPFDGVAFQMHKSSRGFDYQSFAENMRRFGKLGIELYVSEMDVKIENKNPTRADLSAQADVYWNVLDRALQEPAFKGFQTWGITDKYSFMSEHHPLPFDASFGKKPAYGALENRLQTGGKTRTYLLVNKASGKALHVAGNSKERAAPVVQFERQPAWIAQKWQLDYVGGRAYTVTNLNSRLALKVVDGSRDYGAPIEQYTRDASLESERWELVYAGAGYHALRNVRSGRLLGAKPGDDFAPVIQAHLDGGPQTTPADAEQWRLESVD